MSGIELNNKGELLDNLINSFSTNKIKIKSEWISREFLDESNLNYKQLSSMLFIYFSLYRFVIKNDVGSYFSFNLKLLSKVTGLSKIEIVDSLRLLNKIRIIENVSIERWSRLNEKELIILQDCGFDKSNSDEYYVYVDLNLYDELIRNGKLEYGVVYLLLLRYTNNAEGKCWLKYSQINSILGIAPNTITKIVRWLNDHNYIASYYKSSGNSISKLEHYVVRNGNEKERKQFNEIHLNNKKKNLIKWNSKNKNEKS